MTRRMPVSMRLRLLREEAELKRREEEANAQAEACVRQKKSWLNNVANREEARASSREEADAVQPKRLNVQRVNWLR